MLYLINIIIHRIFPYNPTATAHFCSVIDFNRLNTLGLVEDDAGGFHKELDGAAAAWSLGVDGRMGIEFGLCFHPAPEVTVRMHQLTKK